MLYDISWFGAVVYEKRKLLQTRLYNLLKNFKYSL